MHIRIVPKCSKCGHRLIQNLSGTTQVSDDSFDNPTIQLMVDPHCPGCAAVKKRRPAPVPGQVIELEGKSNKPRLVYSCGVRNPEGLVCFSSYYKSALAGVHTHGLTGKWRLPGEDKWST